MKLFEHFCKFLQNSACFCTIFLRFILTPFAQTTHAASQHSLIDQKQTRPFEKQKNTAISPQF